MNAARVGRPYGRPVPVALRGVDHQASHICDTPRRKPANQTAICLAPAISHIQHVCRMPRPRARRPWVARSPDRRGALGRIRKERIVSLALDSALDLRRRGLARHLSRRQRASSGGGKLEAYDPAAPRAVQAPIEVQHKLTVVLPVKIRSHHGHSELERIERLLLPSFLKFFALDDLHEFIVIAPPEDADQVRAGVEPFAEALRLKVLCDDEIAPRAGEMKRGWRKQQTLKLGIARFIRTPWYLAVDSDNLLVRPTGYWLYLESVFQGRSPLRPHGSGATRKLYLARRQRIRRSLVRRVFEGAQAPFTVVQSRIADLSVSDIHARVGRYLELTTAQPITSWGRRRS